MCNCEFFHCVGLTIWNKENACIFTLQCHKQFLDMFSLNICKFIYTSISLKLHSPLGTSLKWMAMAKKFLSFPVIEFHWCMVKACHLFPSNTHFVPSFYYWPPYCILPFNITHVFTGSYRTNFHSFSFHVISSVSCFTHSTTLQSIPFAVAKFLIHILIDIFIPSQHPTRSP